MNKFTVQPLATVSTCHITAGDDQLLLTAPENIPGLSVYVLVPGYLIYLVNEPGLEPGLTQAGFSAAFVRLVEELVNAGIRVFRLDPDGPVSPDLETFVW